MRAALRRRDVLREHGVPTVEVEIIEHCIRPLASSASPPAAVSVKLCLGWSYSRVLSFMSRMNFDLAGINSHVMPLLPFAGCRIEQEAPPQPGQSAAAAGTLGLFVTLGPKKIMKP